MVKHTKARSASRNLNLRPKPTLPSRFCLEGRSEPVYGPSWRETKLGRGGRMQALGLHPGPFAEGAFSGKFIYYRVAWPP